MAAVDFGCDSSSPWDGPFDPSITIASKSVLMDVIFTRVAAMIGATRP
jgi:hypothetical protein